MQKKAISMEEDKNWVVEQIEKCSFIQLYRIRRNIEEVIFILLDEDSCLIFLKQIKPKDIGLDYGINIPPNFVNTDNS